MTLARFVRRVPVVAALALCGGCAVLTVEVDVYKGPLANDECVQAQRVAAMAAGARPTLVLLRNRLEADAGCDSPEQVRERLDRFPRASQIEAKDFKSHHARLINDILCLYEDETGTGPELQRIIERGRGNIERLRTARLHLVPLPGSDEAVEDAEIAQLLRTDIAGESEAVKGLREKYALFLSEIDDRGQRQVEEVIKAAVTLAGPEDHPTGPRSEMLNTAGKYDALEVARRRKLEEEAEGRTVRPHEEDLDATNVRFAALEDETLLRAHAGLLFPDKTHEETKGNREKFVNRVRTIAHSFLEARRACAGLIDAFVDGLLVVLGDSGPGHEARQSIVRRGVDALVSFVSLTRLETALENQSKRGLGGADQERIEAFRAAYAKSEGRLGSDEARELIRTIVLRDPVEHLQALKVLHRQLSLGARFPKESHLAESALVGVPVAREIGIAVGPNNGGTDYVTKLASDAEDAATALGGSLLGKARLPEGIDTVVRRYLVVAAKACNDACGTSCKGTCDDAMETREWTQMLDALASFGSTLEMISDWAGIYDGEAPGGRALGYGKQLRLLQAIGSAIVAQVDALRYRERHAERDEAAGRYQRAVLERLYPARPSDAVRSALARLDAAAGVGGPPASTAKAAAVLLRGLLPKALGAGSGGIGDSLDRADALGWALTEAYLADAIQQSGAVEPGPKVEKPSAPGPKEEKPPALATKEEKPPAPGKEEAKKEDAKKEEAKKEEAKKEEAKKEEAKKEEAKKEKAKKEEAKAAALEAVSSAFRTRLRPPTPDSQAGALEVYDDLLAYLREEHVKAVAMEGKDTDWSLRLQDAIERAEFYRSDLIHIRPATAFLRTVVMPASGAAIDPTGPAINELARQIPGVSLFSDSPGLQDEFDRRSWQTINRVRVAGTGDTNYVLVKDDIGNWYVKNYSADPKKIIKSAQGLALFGMGEKMGMDLLSAAGDAAPDGGAAAGGPALESRSALERFRKRFRDGAATDHDALRTSLGSLAKSVQDDWEKRDGVKGEDGKTVRDACIVILTEKAKSLTGALEADAKKEPGKTQDAADAKKYGTAAADGAAKKPDGAGKPARRPSPAAAAAADVKAPDRTVTLLQALLDFEAEVKKDIGAKAEAITDATTKGRYEKAQAGPKEKVGALFQETVRKRTEAAREYRNAIQTLAGGPAGESSAE